MGGGEGGLVTGLKMCSKACYISSAFLKLQNAIKKIFISIQARGGLILGGDGAWDL